MRQNGGFALVAALLLVAVVGIVTATVLQTTSTEVGISGNYKRAIHDFYAAEAGVAEARARVWKAPGTAESFIVGAGVWSSPLWTAYIAASSDWSPSLDPEYSTQDTNMIPVPGNPANTTVRPNSLQTTLPYWVKIRHQTEYDAEQAGHTPATPHYVDLDGSLGRHNRNDRGNVVYFGYPSPTSLVPAAFTTTMAVPWWPVETIVAHGRITEGGVVLEEDVVHPPGPPHLGAIYASGNVSLNAGAGVINGHDACGMVNGLPPVLAAGTVTSTPPMLFDGNPASPRPHALAFNLDAALAALTKGAVVLNADQHHQRLGTAEAPMVFLATREAFAGQPLGIRIRQTIGDGILLVDGNATLEGEVHWNGMVLVTGTLFLIGQGTGIVIHGGVWAGRLEQRTPQLHVQYDSCTLRTALLAVPVLVRNWKEVF